MSEAPTKQQQVHWVAPLIGLFVGLVLILLGALAGIAAFHITNHPKTAKVLGLLWLSVILIGQLVKRIRRRTREKRDREKFARSFADLAEEVSSEPTAKASVNPKERHPQYGVHVKFIEESIPECPLTRNDLAQKVVAIDQYNFDRSKVRSLVEAVLSLVETVKELPTISIHEIYSTDRSCQARTYKHHRTVVLDYGFIELMADNMAVESLGHHAVVAMNEWAQAGRPVDYEFEDDPGFFRVDGEREYITASMAMRDLASKFLEAEIRDESKRKRILDGLLWKLGDRRPNRLYVQHQFESKKEALAR